jgi:Transposase DDE domain group 1
VAQLAAVHRQVLARLAQQAPLLLAGGDTLAFVDIDSVQRRVYGATKQGAAFGHATIASKSLMVRGLNALIATVSTPVAAPVVAAAQLRGGNAAWARGAARLVAQAIGTARGAGVSGTIVVRGDSAYYHGAFIAACRRNGARFSVTARMDRTIQRTITTIPDDTWVSIKYPHALYDPDTDTWISDAQIAEVPYTAFASRRKHRTHGRLIIRRVTRLNPNAAAQGQGELFTAYRYHAVFIDTPFPLVQAESQHRGHAIIEQINADLIDGALAQLPCADFHANPAWLQLAVTAHTDPRLGHPGLDPTRQSPRRDHPPRTHPGRRPPSPQRTRPHHLAPTRQLALARRLDRRLPRHPPSAPAQAA